MTTEEVGKRIAFVAGAMSALVVGIAGIRFLLSGLPLDLSIVWGRQCFWWLLLG